MMLYDKTVVYSNCNLELDLRQFWEQELDTWPDSAGDVAWSPTIVRPKTPL